MRIVIFCLLAIAAVAQDSALSLKTSYAPGPISVTARIDLPPNDDLVKLGMRDPAAAPAKAIWLWEQRADKSVDASELSWTRGAMSATATHSYAKPGKYFVTVQVVDSKRRLILNRSVVLTVRDPVSTCPPTCEEK